VHVPVHLEKALNIQQRENTWLLILISEFAREGRLEVREMQGLGDGCVEGAFEAQVDGDVCVCSEEQSSLCLQCQSMGSGANRDSNI
jgi:hypothetical protein